MNPRKRKEGESEDSSEATSTSKKRRQKGTMEERFEERGWTRDIRTKAAKSKSFYGAKGRLDHSKFYVDKDGKRHRVKTSYVTMAERLLDDPAAKEQAQQEKAAVHQGEDSTFRKVKSPARSAAEPKTATLLNVMETPDGKTPMYLKGIFGVDQNGLGFYSSIPPRTVEQPKTRKNLNAALEIEKKTPEELAKAEAAEIESEKKRLAALNTVVKPQGPSKTNSMLVTNRQMQDVAKELDLNGGKRSVPGGAVMAAPGVSRVSANDYAENLGDVGLFITEFDGKKIKRRFEWVHGGISHEVGGKKTQKPEMLTCDTFEMNNWYILGENTHHYLAKKFPGGFTINSNVALMSKMIDGKLEYTHIPDGIIKIKIVTSTGFEHDYSLDTKYRDNNPHIDFAKYVLSHVQKTIENWETTQASKNTLKPPR